LFEIEGMKTRKNKTNNSNKTLKNIDFLKPTTKWQKRLKTIADRDLALIPTSVDNKYKLGGSYSILSIHDGKIKIHYKLSQELKSIIEPRYNQAKSLLEILQTKLKSKKFPNISIPLYVGDSYAWDYNGPFFCFSKPKNKNGLLVIGLDLITTIFYLIIKNF
jgi:hypothetical protein